MNLAMNRKRGTIENAAALNNISVVIYANQIGHAHHFE